MNKLKYIALVLFLSNLIPVLGQDMHFSQFYASSIYLNPAFAGANVCSRVSLMYRNQWSGVKTGYTTTMASWDHYIKRNNLGLGLLLARDVAGSGSLSTTLVYPTFAYEARIDRKFGIRFGIQPGFGNSSIDFNKLTFGDQIARGGNVATVETAPSSSSYFDVNAGVLAFTGKMWLGFAFSHINSPVESFYGFGEPLPIKTSVHGGYKFELEEGEKSITAAFNYRGQKKFDQLDIGAYYTTREIINIGLWYRGLPFIKSYAPGYANNASIVLILGVKNEVMSVGYSYDFTISRLSHNNSHGSHELTLSYQFCSLRNQRGRRITVECPSF